MTDQMAELLATIIDTNRGLSIASLCTDDKQRVASLDKRGYVIVRNYANGPHVEHTDEGSAAYAAWEARLQAA